MSKKSSTDSSFSKNLCKFANENQAWDFTALGKELGHFTLRRLSNACSCCHEIWKISLTGKNKAKIDVHLVC